MISEQLNWKHHPKSRRRFPSSLWIFIFFHFSFLLFLNHHRHQHGRRRITQLFSTISLCCCLLSFFMRQLGFRSEIAPFTSNANLTWKFIFIVEKTLMRNNYMQSRGIFHLNFSFLSFLQFRFSILISSHIHTCSMLHKVAPFLHFSLQMVGLVFKAPTFMQITNKENRIKP